MVTGPVMEPAVPRATTPESEPLGMPRVPSDVPAGELAAYTMVANVLLNLDEVVTNN